MEDNRSMALAIRLLSETDFEPFGTMLGKPYPKAPDPAAFSNAATDFWQEHLFDAGPGGEVEILWVNYWNPDLSIGVFENHLLTEQAVAPLIGSITQVVALSGPDGLPDRSTAKAFLIEPGQGVCMNPGVWHATRSGGSTCLMLTRRSTTLALVAQLNQLPHADETILYDLGDQPIRIELQCLRPDEEGTRS
ncbi:ureidoglycolate lyase [Neorhizobium sp. S3-V5DH]|uniref:ureidoglycolate lyase n=1 Tax=Neorhizobium sp. S3-V5DH TaxID=2485166 RepID=UPI0010E96EBD|nr:ureidoglycolate lyase [Neorhizobium sp. S3-V5DH]TCV60259.1 ureidoglycolate lyase [Neorhizobium sp. S3-V5DH]